jgi:hypothetical protein
MSESRTSRSEETQTARPSGEDPMAARERLTIEWWLAPAFLLAIAVAIVAFEFLL